MSEEPMDFGFDVSFATPGVSQGRPLDPGHTYDVLVLGAGPAGLSAAIYLIRKGLDTGILSGNLGGQVAWTSSIENYLGYRLVEGAQLVEKFNEQIGTFPAGISTGAEVRKVSRREEIFRVETEGESYLARTLILATGKRPRRLNVPGEERLMGRGVAFCAICDAPLYRDKVTAVVGGGNSGLEAAIDLARVSPKVHLVEREKSLNGDAILIDEVNRLSNVEILLQAEVTEILGEGSVRAIRITQAGRSDTREIPVEGVFVEIGLVPNSEAFRGFVNLNEWGEVEVDCLCRTSAPGVFAAGDVTAVPYKQIVIAAGEGAKAALSAYEYVLRHGIRG